MDELKAFVLAGQKLLKGLFPDPTVEGEPELKPLDYDHPFRRTPGHWISSEQIRQTHIKMTECIAAEKWMEGFQFMLQILMAIGGGV